MTRFFMFLLAFLCLTVPAFAEAPDEVLRALNMADNARTALDQSSWNGSSRLRLEQLWREREVKLEGARLRAFADAASIPQDEVRTLRKNGKTWEEISRQYSQSPTDLGIGSRRYNQYDRTGGPWTDYYKSAS